MFASPLRRFACSLTFLAGWAASGSELPTGAKLPNDSSPAAVLQPFLDRHEVAGAVTLVANRAAILDLQAVGFSDVQALQPMSTDALFWIASQSKSITATALMMLVDAGKVNVEDPVEKYLPEFHQLWLTTEKTDTRLVLQRPSHPIKVREILSHTSGLPFQTALETPTLDAWPLAANVRSYPLVPLQFDPGTKYQYSNAGINTVGRIIEVVSGLPYAEFLRTQLFEPLGMKDTTFWPSPAQLRRLAKSYRPNATKDNLVETVVTQLHYPLSDPQRSPMPAGGLFSTAQDLARFCQMILNEGTLEGHRYLSPESVKLMTTKQTGDAVQEGYGFGWSVHGAEFGHGGAYATNMNIDPARHLITIFLVQHAGFPGSGGQAREVWQKQAVARFGQIP